tara:strand:+ start:2806 stop:4662 length:1857 start_codon:yes stop_codon:yes gene_type:complete
LLCFSSYSNAQSVSVPSGQTGNILIIGNGWTGNFSTCTHNVNCWAGSSDSGDIHNAPAGTTGNGSTFYWSGTQNTLSNTIAINTALAQAGIQVDGFDYEWVFKNGNANWFAGQPGGGGVDPFEIVVNVYDSNGNLFKTYRYDYGTNFANWTYDTGTETFGTNYLDPSFFGNVEVLVTGKDIAGQAGYWGPEFRADESGLYVNYSANLCYNNPLHDPTCSGYANALFQQQCTANPLFDPACPGYANAYLTQQCSANPLYDPACPGYANAYYNQQCTLDPLYDSGCTGYQTAYLNQQCSLDPLYDPQCTGYSAAYLLQQCDLDPLYDITCIGYQQAYVEKQCESDPLYDVTCIGYNEAIALQDTTEEYVDDGIVDTEIDIVGTTIVEGIPNVMSLPELPVIEIFELEDTIVKEDYDIVEGDALAMEDDIEKEIAELERAEEEEIIEEENVSNPFEKERDETEDTPGERDGSVGGQGETTSEDDIEKEIAELEEIEITDDGSDEELADGDTVPSEEIDEPEKKKVVKKKSTKEQKIRMLLAQKAIELTKKVEESVSIEQQMLVQRQLLALISYVPGFDYNEKRLPQVNFYPPKPVVDHAYARWFLNDPRFGEMEDSQYNFK